MFSNFLSFLLLITLNLTGSTGKVVKHVFQVSYFEGSPDGVHKENILGINGQFPGPLIEADLGDVLQIDLINNIQDGQNTTIHWHGIHQRGSALEDGTTQLSQCPLRTGGTQKIEFSLDQAGTYWYHSHVHSQYTEGLWGVLIVRNKPEVYTYDDEIVITLNDWYHRTAVQLEQWHISKVSNGVPPYPDSGLLNGLGRYNCTVAALQNRTCDPGKQTRSVFKVQKNKTYRIRIINTSAVAAFNFSIDGHRLEAIEVDGIDVARPVLIDSVSIAAAQRYSFLLKANSYSSNNRFLIRANLRTDMLLLSNFSKNINRYPRALLQDVTAVLEYFNLNDSNSSSKVAYTTETFSYLEQVPPPSTVGNQLLLKEDQLTPYDRKFAPSYFDKEFILDVDFHEDHEDIRRGSFNRTPFVLSEGKPMLLTVLDAEPIPEQAMVFHIDYNSVIQIVINNSGFVGPHPFHLHGHHFWVLGTGDKDSGAFDPNVHRLTRIGAKRDTVLVEQGSWAVIRFVADNPGVWPFHCHIDWHHLSGMTVVFVEGAEMLRKKIRRTDESIRLCDGTYANETEFGAMRNGEVKSLNLTSLRNSGNRMYDYRIKYIYIIVTCLKVMFKR